MMYLLKAPVTRLKIPSLVTTMLPYASNAPTLVPEM